MRHLQTGTRPRAIPGGRRLPAVAGNRIMSVTLVATGACRKSTERGRAMGHGGRTPRKVIIVEGKSDRDRLLAVLEEPVQVVCTRGTLSYATLEDLILPLQDEEVYILVDADEPGMKLRRQLQHELPNAKHLYTRRVYREVARTPLNVLAKVLYDAHFAVDERLLMTPEGCEPPL